MDRERLLYPHKSVPDSFLQATLSEASGPFVAVSDNMKMVSDQIGQWVPGGLLSLGTDGFGRSDTRDALRDFFEVNAPMIVLAAVTQLHKTKVIDQSLFDTVYSSLNIAPNKRNPFCT